MDRCDALLERLFLPLRPGRRRRRLRRRVLLAVLAALAGGPAAPARAEEPIAAPETVDVCASAEPFAARCLAQLIVAGGPRPEIGARGEFVPAGFSPAQIKAAHDFPTEPRAGKHQTIAIVSAFDSPTVEADLAVFSKQFGLKRCTTGNGCFSKVNDTGGTTYPAFNAGWALETNLDVQWAHAIAPGAKILLVEASSNSFADLFRALYYAVQHASYVSGSWGGDEFAQQTIFDPLLKFPGVSEFFGSGDFGAGAFFPASSPDVIAVGGTRLKLKRNGKVKKESGWALGGGGCSAIYTASAAQSSFGANQSAGCGDQRAAPDVAMVSDPGTPGAAYIGFSVGGETGWITVGGTSLAAPIVAARAAITGEVFDAAEVYSDREFRDVTRGNNGFAAGPGYDLVTGRGALIH